MQDKQVAQSWAWQADPCTPPTPERSFVNGKNKPATRLLLGQLGTVTVSQVCCLHPHGGWLVVNTLGLCLRVALISLWKCQKPQLQPDPSCCKEKAVLTSFMKQVISETTVCHFFYFFLGPNFPQSLNLHYIFQQKSVMIKKYGRHLPQIHWLSSQLLIPQHMTAMGNSAVKES